ncbi:hypothetical protein K3495_g463 [Podosphaera aphanis]|nr:hypothetical protein K3495_g463 [Podosphaera aphanis]
MISQSAYLGAKTWTLKRFLKPLKDAGFSPTFFGCDKDQSEIKAIQLVWPSVTVQLCDSGSDGDSVEANIGESEDESEEAPVQSDDEIQEIDAEDGVSIKLAISSFLEEQKKIGNVKFHRADLKSRLSLSNGRILLEQIGQPKRNRTMLLETWARYRHLTTRFYS